MPEVAIGFFPDVGATWFLPRMPGELGTFCAVTGERLKAADGVAAGIATHQVKSVNFPALLDRLCSSSAPEGVLADLKESPEPGPIAALRPIIDATFGADTVEDIFANLARIEHTGGPQAQWAAATAATIRSRSPTSLKLALAQVRRGRSWSFEECMQAEFRIVSRVVYGHDFYEGVRAVIIDKDNQPQWRPSTLAEVGVSDVERYFGPLQRELQLP
jgi:enoyl-CoA hydratase